MLKTTNHPNRLLIFSRPCRLTSISLEDEFQENICFIDYAKAFDCVKSYDKPRQRIKKERHHFANKDPYSQSYGFSSSHVWIWNLDHKEARVLKNWCFQIVVVEKNLENLSDCKEIKPVNCKGNQPEYSLEGLMLKLKLQYFGNLMWKPDSLENTVMLGKTEGKRRWRRQSMRQIASLTQCTWIWANSGR